MLEGEGRSTKNHTQDCRSSPSEVCSLRLDEPVSEAVNRETALCEERKVWVSKRRMRDRYGFKYVTSAVAVCCACSRVSGGLAAKQRFLARISATDNSDSDQLCFSVRTRISNSATLLPRSVYSTNTLTDFGVCYFSASKILILHFLASNGTRQRALEGKDTCDGCSFTPISWNLH
jgi:hypothetical protein